MARHVEDTDAKLVMANAFRISAFAQFHCGYPPVQRRQWPPMPIHFQALLDSVLPIPIAMFEDREGYLQMLRQGRTVDPLQAPEALFKMLLRAAIDSYRRILCMHGCVPSHDAVVVAMSLVAAHGECQRHLHADDMEAATCWLMTTTKRWRPFSTSTKRWRPFSTSHQRESVAVWRGLTWPPALRQSMEPIELRRLLLCSASSIFSQHELEHPCCS